MYLLYSFEFSGSKSGLGTCGQSIQVSPLVTEISDSDIGGVFPSSLESVNKQMREKSTLQAKGNQLSGLQGKQLSQDTPSLAGKWAGGAAGSFGSQVKLEAGARGLALTHMEFDGQ